MEPKKFNLDDWKPERELFKVDETYFEKLPVILADQVHKALRPKPWFIPALSFGLGAVALLVFTVVFLVNRAGTPQQVASTNSSTEINAQDLMQIMLDDEDLQPTEDELIEQLAMVEDQSEERAIQELLDEENFLDDNILFDEI